ncbi:acyl-CoA dehydrogenase family protein [Marinobacter oulmenensis]|uniref:Acyl-CoA dehydrogenase n=1 Tax=Marinobacter oulmenensis TaxID=643747 RepID=A0A840U4D4_9GAMM|nr:acyl-CoA dehydrogenase family protein [Marinobacter oulmenensis]MBB5319762.1 acyl-CoA dehydrogenase [Marinobacter oulmenensis]
MDFSLTEEQQMIIETARKVGSEFGLEYWAEKDEKKEFPTECWQAICDAGLAGASLPVEFGGSNLGMLEMALIIEELAASGAGATVGQMFMINPIFGGVSVSKFGSPAMQNELLPALADGRLNFCMALTEPDAGTNTLAMKTFASPEGDGWRLNGRKIWITAVDAAQKMLVVARTRKAEEVERPTQGISMFVIDVDREGLSYTPIDKVGTRTLSACSVFFDDVFIRSDELIGTLDNGFKELLHVLNTERVVTTACMVGAGRLAERLAIQYANDRKVFGGRPISAYQGLQFPLAQSHAELKCARLMNLHAAALYDAGHPYASEANTAKLIGSQAATHAIERSMQAMGGMGYAKEFHVERLWRDARLFKFAPISEEMILNFIATHDLGMPKSY